MENKVAIIFGGKSAEFEVSLNSASNIFNMLDKSKFDVILIGIDKRGKWFFNPDYLTKNINLLNNNYLNNAKPIFIERNGEKISVVSIETNNVLESFDVAFSIIHGTFGEDGTLQGFFKTLNIPFVGPDVLGSAICMDKEVTKRLLRDNDIPVADFIVLRKNQKIISFELAKERLGLPLFIKPCNAGSSLGVNKVPDKDSFKDAISEAFRYDNKILIEEAIIGKEVECAILGNEDPQASIIGEIVPTRDFYSYDAKYNDSEGAKIKIPADIDVKTKLILRKTAVEAFEAACCEGLARVDFFLRKDNTFVVNEINTLPGFTGISMYPKLWQDTGITYPDLITKLIELAIQRNKRDATLKI